LPTDSFERNVFINCPFDQDYEPILEAILFCLLYCGFSPRIATESIESSAVRLRKIHALIEECKFSIHDLSRCQAEKKGEHYHLNMPFELGMDYGCQQYSGRSDHRSKRILILEEKQYRYQAAISDLSGCDVHAHGNRFDTAVRKVRNWLVSEAGASAEGATRILGAYADFQEWYYESQLSQGFSEEDIQDYPTSELLAAMKDWIAKGKPLSCASRGQAIRLIFQHALAVAHHRQRTQQPPPPA